MSFCAFALSAQVDSTQQTYFVNGIVVDGIESTKERVILREITVSTGDSLVRDALYQELERSRQNIQNLGLFNSVMVLPLFINSRDILIQVVVHERWYLWPVPIFELAETNFNTWWLTKDFRRTNYGGYLYWYNFTGNNDRLYAKFQFGYTKQFAAEYRSGFVDNKGNWGFKSGWSYAQNAEITLGTADNKRIFYSPSNGNSREVVKVYTDLMYRKAYDTRHTIGITFTDANVLDTVTAQNADYFRNSRSTADYLSLQYEYLLDRRDETRFTRDGYLLSLKVRQDGLGILNTDDLNLTTAKATAIYWWKLKNNVSLSSSVRFKGTLQDEVPYFLQEGLGYSDYVRGYEFYVIDGQDYALFKQNVHFPIIKPFETRLERVPIEAFRAFYFAAYLNLFIDAGIVSDNLYADQNFLANEWMYGYGIGLDLVTSYDRTLRLEYTFNRLNESGLFIHFELPF
jgi:outer membrane protein assembly factor BamA